MLAYVIYQIKCIVTMNAYEFCKMILEAPNGGVEALLKAADMHEQQWLEFKASTQLLPAQQQAGLSQKDLYWNIARAIIAMMNTGGGAVIIGIAESEAGPYRVPLRDAQNNVIKDTDLDKYFRYIRSKVWSHNTKKTWGERTKFESKTALPDLITIEEYEYKGGPVAVILVKPSYPSIRIVEWDNNKETEEILYRVNGAQGMIERLRAADDVVGYDKKIRQMEDFSLRYKKFCCENNCPIRNKRNKRKHILVWSSIIVLLIIYTFFILPIHLAPASIYPIPGIKTPDQLVVEKPHFTIEWYNLNHKIWWTVGDYVDTAYGRWEMQRNKVFGNYRIIDPRNITRSWGTQKDIVEIFAKLKEQLKKECPPQKKQDLKK